MRLGATREAAEVVADKVEARVYDGIETRKILQMIFRYMKRHRPAVGHRIDLRKALSLLNPAPDFERYVQLLLSEHGYEVTSNRIVRGRCVEHEVDAVARKDGKTCIVEVKHHFKPHTPIGLDVSRISWAVLEDVNEAYRLGLNSLKVDYALIVCNTKLSEHAKRYAECKGIHHIGWGSPHGMDLQTMIEQKKFYPVTLLKGVNVDTRNRLTSAGVILLRQLVESNVKELRKETEIPRKTLEQLSSNARVLLKEV